MIVIRNFRKEDLPQIISLVYETFSEMYSEEIYIEMHEKWEGGMMVAEDSGKIIGFLFGVLQFPKEARILVLAIDKNYRNKKIGSFILKEFIDRAILKDARIISLEVKVQNEKAIRFYQRFGFEISHLIEHYYKDGGDAYLMQKFV